MTEKNDRAAIIRLFHVCKRFKDKAALADITFDVYKNDFIFIHGPSGAGKSTLLKMIYLAEPISEGQIIVGGMNLSRIPRKKIPFIRREYGIIFQDFRLIPSKTVLENVSLVLEVKGNSGKAMQRKVKGILKTVGMENKLNAYPPTLSGGEQQRVAIARAVVGEPKIILADEPTGSLDHDSADIVMDLLEKFHSHGTTIIMATHDESLFNRVNGRVIRLQEGHLKTFSENEELMQ